MSHRVEQKARARAAREEAERREAAQEARRKRFLRLALAGMVTLAVVAAAVATTVGGGAAADQVKGAAETRAMLDGISQDGTFLGDPEAPVVLTEYADLQCPFCRQFAVDALPQVIERYVRTGKVRVDLRLLRFVGADSVRGARGAMAAAEDDRLWNYVDLFYRNQGPENTGYADDGFLRGIATAAGASGVLAAVRDEAYEQELVAMETDAQSRGIDSTPSFTIGRRGGEQRPLVANSLDFATFERAIEASLKR